MLITLQTLKSLFDQHKSAEDLSVILTSQGLEVERLVSMEPTFTVERGVVVDKQDGGYLVVCANQQFTLRTNALLKLNKGYAITATPEGYVLVTPSKLGWSSLTEPLLIPAGMSFNAAWEVPDTLIELSIGPNRGDCLSYLGLVRELCLEQRQALDHHSLFNLWQQRYPVQWTGQTSIQAQLDPSVCVSYAVTELVLSKQVESPFWLERFLIKHGLTPNNLLVDLTQYLMMIFGQPLHAFDYDHLRFPLEVKQLPSSSQEVTLLTGKTIKLSSSAAVIAHQDNIYALAGVMGASAGSVSTSTQHVLVEAASFVPKMIRSMRAFGITTDASARFERGVDPQLQATMLKLFCGLVQSIDAQAQCRGPQAVLQASLEPQTVTLTQNDVDALVGAPLPVQEMQQIIAALGGVHDGVNIHWAVPSWRFDVSLKQDVIEEIVRLYGLDRLPKLPVSSLRHPVQLSEPVDPWVHVGFHEVITYSFINTKQASIFSEEAPIVLSNPISQEMAAMRSSLWPSLLNVAALNKRFGVTGLKLVEAAPVYSQQYPLKQRNVIAAMLMEDDDRRSWHQTQLKKIDFYTVKGLLEQLLAHHGNLAFAPSQHYPGLHPQLQMTIVVDGVVKGIFGQLHPEIAHSEGWPAAWLIECDATLMQKSSVTTYKPFSRMPKITRDLALIVPNNLPVAEIVGFIQKNQSQALQSVNVFDYYKGDRIADGFMSLGVELIFQHPTKTLEEAEVASLVQEMLEHLYKKYGITLRD